MRLTDETGQDKRSLSRQLIHWRGGHPAGFLATLPPGSAETLDGLLKARRRQQLMRRRLRRILIDSGILLSDDQQQQPLHQLVVASIVTMAAR